MSDNVVRLVAIGARAEVERANRNASAIVTEFGVPESYEKAVELVAYAYAKGQLEGYQEAANTALNIVDIRDTT